MSFNVLHKMDAIHAMIERMRARPDIHVVNQEQSWKLLITKGRTYLCEITIPHAMLEWHASVQDRTRHKEVWNDWMDYEGYDDTPKSDLNQSMAEDVERFVDRVSKKALNLPLNIYEPKETKQQNIRVEG